MTQTVLLGDICDIKIGRTPPRKEEQWFSSVNGNKWVSIKDMGNSDKNIYSTSEYLTDEAVARFRIPKIEKGTLLLSFKLTVGRLGFATEDMYSNEAIAQLPVRDAGAVDKDYLYYYLKNFNFDSLSSTSSIATAVNSQTIKKIQINLPDLETQKKIADILGTIDEKIELNRKMNETLEQMGQALFRHYFIDNPEAQKWESGTIADLGEVITGKTPSKAKAEYYGGDVMFLKVPDMHGRSIIIKTEDMLSSLGADSQKKKYIPKWSTCVSCIATVGIISLAGEQLQTNQQINSIVPKSREYALHNYYLMKSKSEIIKTMASGGSATPNLNKGHFESIKIKLPPIEVLERFQGEAESLLEMVYENTRQIQTLATLRDTLLPPLISGKVKV